MAIWAIAGVALAAAVVLVVLSLAFGKRVKTYAEVAGIYIEGQALLIPNNTGIREDRLFWLHTHGDSGLIHIESPERSQYYKIVLQLGPPFVSLPDPTPKP